MNELDVPLERRISDAKYLRGEEFARTSKTYTLDMVPDGQALDVLYVGCGTGRNAEAIASKGHRLLGVDISPIAIERFRARGFDGEVCDLNQGLPFAPSRFNLVFASEVIEHLADTKRFLIDAYRVLALGGRLILSTPNSAFWAYRLCALV